MWSDEFQHQEEKNSYLQEHQVRSPGLTRKCNIYVWKANEKLQQHKQKEKRVMEIILWVIMECEEQSSYLAKSTGVHERKVLPY